MHSGSTQGKSKQWRHFKMESVPQSLHMADNSDTCLAIFLSAIILFWELTYDRILRPLWRWLSLISAVLFFFSVIGTRNKAAFSNYIVWMKILDFSVESNQYWSFTITVSVNEGFGSGVGMQEPLAGLTVPRNFS